VQTAEYLEGIAVPGIGAHLSQPVSVAVKVILQPVALILYQPVPATTVLIMVLRVTQDFPTACAAAEAQAVAIGNKVLVSLAA
jgi:hypothetical protein